MRNLFFFLSILICGSAYGQDVTAIRKTVEQINKASNYTLKTVPNEYFVEKGQVTDNGSGLKGFYHNGELKKNGIFGKRIGMEIPDGIFFRPWPAGFCPS